jgi:hypothetical protein
MVDQAARRRDRRRHPRQTRAGSLELDVCAVEPVDLAHEGGLRVARPARRAGDVGRGSALRVDLGPGGGGARVRIDAQAPGELPLCGKRHHLAGLVDDARARIAQGVYLETASRW